ncbi:MAG: hypothetical protein QM536_02020 [Chitinophagaceae bacterium]|nr:hypothetical protein [Chitinophagaceae bacterium]
MIVDRLDNNGKIKDEYRLEFIQQKKQEAGFQDIFSQMSNPVVNNEILR